MFHEILIILSFSLSAKKVFKKSFLQRCNCCALFLLQIREAVDTVIALLEAPGKDQLYALLFENGCAELLYTLLVDKQYSDALRDSVFKVGYRLQILL